MQKPTTHAVHNNLPPSTACILVVVVVPDKPKPHKSPIPNRSQHFVVYTTTNNLAGPGPSIQKDPNPLPPSLTPPTTPPPSPAHKTRPPV